MNDNEKIYEEDPLLEYKDIRSDDIKEIWDLIKRTGARRIRHSIKYYPFRFFADGVQAYKYSFDNAVMFYTGTAVEIGLLIKLKNQIEQQRKIKPKFIPDFKWLISHSKSLLNKELMITADNIRIMRNCYIHYQNIITHTAWMDQVSWPNTVKRMKAECGDDPQINQLIELMSNQLDQKREKDGMLTIRFDFLELNKETMPFIKHRYGEYLKWLPEIWSVKKDIIRNDDLRWLYGIETFDALSCIKWSFEVLRGLNYL